MSKFIKQFEHYINSEKSNPFYYLDSYLDEDTYTSININTHAKKEYTGLEYKELFLSWFNKINPFLEAGDEFSALEILSTWDEETVAKFDMYSLVRNYFKK